MKTRLTARISVEAKEKILEYGKGSPHQGVMNLLKIAEAKEVTVNIITQVKV